MNKTIEAQEFLIINHLAPYLPHDLKLDLGEGYIGRYQTLEINNMDMCLAKQYKPVLKPISDLSILVRDEFEKYDGKRSGQADIKVIELFCEENGVDEIIENIDLKSLPYECVEYIFENHYDYFGLIEKGLATSIHETNLNK